MKRKLPRQKPGLNPFERSHQARLDRTYPKNEQKCSEAACETLATFFDLVDDDALPIVELGCTFCNTFNDLSIGIPQRIMNLIFRMAFKYPTIIPKLAHITHSSTNRGWLFWGLVHVMRHTMDIFKRSIADDAPVWEFILDHLEKDLAERDENENYQTCERGFLIEVLPFYWDIDPNERSSVKMMILTVVQFLVETGSKTAFRLLDLLFQIFPKEVEEGMGEQVWRLSPVNLARSKNRDWSKAPKCLEFALKLLFVDEELAFECAGEDKEKLREIMENFNREDGTIHFT